MNEILPDCIKCKLPITKEDVQMYEKLKPNPIKYPKYIPQKYPKVCAVCVYYAIMHDIKEDVEHEQ
jgi:hypothetical protein